MKTQKKHCRSQALFALVLSAVCLTAGAARAQNSGGAIYEGFTEPYFDLMVAAAEIGRVEEVLVRQGDKVKRGQILARLEDAMQAASVRIAKLNAEMRGELVAAKAEVTLNEARLNQIRTLARDAMARPDELKRAAADVEISKARHQAALEQTQLRALELERSQLQLDRRKVKAPMDGVVAKVFHQTGEYITPGDPAVVRLLVTDKLYAVFSVPVEDTQKMVKGSEIRIFLRSRAQTVHGQIHSLSPAIDGESGTVQVRVILQNKEDLLRAGDRCTMQMAPNKRAARLPRVLVRSSEKTQLWEMTINR